MKLDKHKAWATTIVAPKLVGSSTTKGQMKPTFQGEFNGVPGRREQPMYKYTQHSSHVQGITISQAFSGSLSLGLCPQR